METRFASGAPSRCGVPALVYIRQKTESPTNPALVQGFCYRSEAQRTKEDTMNPLATGALVVLAIAQLMIAGILWESDPQEIHFQAIAKYC